MASNTTPTEVPPVPVAKGLATWLGVILAVLQYVGAIAVFLAAEQHNDVAIGALVTATATAMATILGRMYQGAKAIEATAPLGESQLEIIAREQRFAMQDGAEIARAKTTVLHEVTLPTGSEPVSKAKIDQRDDGSEGITHALSDDDDPGLDLDAPQADPAFHLDALDDPELPTAGDEEHLVGAHGALRDPGEIGKGDPRG